MKHSYDVIHRSQRTSGIFAQGDADAAYEAIRSGTFDVVVLCAVELEEMFRMLPQRKHPSVVYAPNEDGYALSRRQLRIATHAAERAARAYRSGKRVLITCAAGRNRSGLVTAMALHFVTGCGGEVATEIVRSRRNAAGPALSNPVFSKFLSAIPPKKQEVIKAGEQACTPSYFEVRSSP